MGSRFLTFSAFVCGFVLLGFSSTTSAGTSSEEVPPIFAMRVLSGMAEAANYRVDARALYVSPGAPHGSLRPAAGILPPAVVMSEMSAEEIAKQAWLAKNAPSWGPSRDVAAAGALGTEVPDAGYDWRMNSKDWRFQVVSCIPFGLLFIAVSLQRTKRAELLEQAEECEIDAMRTGVLPENCWQAVAMAAVDGRSEA